MTRAQKITAGNKSSQKNRPSMDRRGDFAAETTSQNKLK